jgi:hypothetical protein
MNHLRTAAMRLQSFGPRRRLRAAPRRAVRAVQSRLARVNRRPVIVLGNQKAGTSAIAGLLAAATGCSVALDLRNEQTAHPAFIRCRLGEISFVELVERNRLDFSRDIVKEPNLSLLYEEVVGYFRDGRVGLVIRDPRDNIRSLLNWLGIPGELAELPDQYYTPLTTVQRSVLDVEWLGMHAESHIEALALRWNMIADTYLHHAERIALIRYEDFCLEKVDAITQLAGRLGLRAQRDISDDVDREFQPPGDRTVTWLEFFGPDNLRRITDVCGDRMREFGYTAPPLG